MMGLAHGLGIDLELDSLAAQADFVFGHNIYSIPITRSILPSITPVAA
jgi:hypothetical protein